MILVIILFNSINNESVISATFKVAGYTYGPLLGLYAFGLFTKYRVKDKFVPIVAIVSPLLCLVLNKYSAEWLFGFKFGFELLIVNGLFTFIGLLLLKEKVGLKEQI